MKILVLGGAGFLGTHFVLRCLEEPGTEVLVMDSLDPRFYSSLAGLETVRERIQFVKGDLRDESLLKKVICHQDVIVNCAAQSSHVLSVRDPFLDAEINCLGNLRLLETIKNHNPEAVVIYPSSSTVIGRTHEEIVDEDQQERPLEIYSAHKTVAEKYYQIYHALYGLKTIVLRFANLYGPFGKNYPEFCFINYFIEQARRDREIQIFGTGEQVRNVTYAGDAAEILWRAWQCADLFGEVCFATSAYYHSVKEIAEAVISIFEKGRLSFTPWPKERGLIEIDPARFSSEKLRGITGWSPSHDLISGLQKTKEILEITSKVRT